MSPVYSVDLAVVASEVIDGEAIVMNLATGMYHSATGVGAVLWQAILDGASHDDLAAALASGFPDKNTGADLATFIAQAKAGGLVTESGTATGAIIAFDGLAYTSPNLESYGDMQDLIMLDPIHDVSEQHGWPVRPAAFGGPAGEVS